MAVTITKQKSCDGEQQVGGHRRSGAISDTCGMNDPGGVKHAELQVPSLVKWAPSSLRII